ncbi:MAG: outer membrane beta-barrel protein [Bacteroidales bacterium]|nr:outer membrane beta-barrel protein [Bacteroidales bacterium]
MKKQGANWSYLQEKRKSSILVLSILILFTLNVKAQTFEVGAYAGAAYYLGDYNTSDHFKDSDLAYGGLLKYNINDRLSIGLSATQTTIVSDAANYNATFGQNEADLNLSLNELAITGEFNFFPYSTSEGNRLWTPYIFGGVGYFSSDYADDFSMPFGLGIKINPVNKIGLNLFWGARKTFTDKIDNIYAGNPSSINYTGYNYDWYIFYGLNITFAFQLKKDTGCRNLIRR